MASASDDETVRLWDAATGNLAATLEGHVGWVNSVDFSPRGDILASGGDDGTVRLWDAATGNRLVALAGHIGWVNSVAFSPNGDILASGAWDGFINLWSVPESTGLSVDPEAEIPATLRLRGNYPNPFNPSTQVVFDLPAASEVTVHVFDLLGREAIVTNPVYLPGGSGHSLTVRASLLPSGVYVYQVRAQTGSSLLVQSGRMILAK